MSSDFDVGARSTSASLLSTRSLRAAWVGLTVLPVTQVQGAADVPSLPAIQVEAGMDATTEGSDAYVAPVLTVGGKTAAPVMSIPQSVSVITRRRIEDQNLRSVEEALAQVTGVTVTPWDGATMQIRSRGYFLEASQDGLPSYSNLNATQQFDLAMFDRVEVLRGPSGLFQGSGQPGGTANFVRKRAPDRFQGTAALTLGSWADKRGELDVGAPLSADGRLRGRVVATLMDRQYHYDRADSQRQFVYGTLEYVWRPDTEVSLYAAFQNDRTRPFTGLPTYTDGRLIDAPRSTNPLAPWSRYHTRKQQVALEARHRLENGWLLRLHASHAEHDWQLHDGYPTSGVDPVTGRVSSYMRRGWDDVSRRDGLDLHASGPFDAFGRRHEATVGMNIEHYRGTTLYGTNTSVPDIPFDQPWLVPEAPIEPHARGSGYETRQKGLYGQVRLNVADPLTLVLGGRVSDFTTRSRQRAPSAETPWSTGTRERGSFTPYAGLVFRLNPQLALYASYSDVFMPQSQKTVDGRALEPREGRQIEVGLKGQAREGRVQYHAAVFQTRDVNRAYRDLANPGFFLPAGQVEIKGAELEISGSPLPNLEMTAGYALLSSHYEQDHNQAPGAQFSLFEPRQSLKLYGTYRFAGTPWQAGTGLLLNSAMIGGGEPGVREGAGYAVVNAQVAYAVNRNTRLTLSVGNLFDRRYYARLGGLNSYNTYGEPRSVSLNLRTRF